MNSNLTMIVVLVSVIHVAVLVLMVWIRVRRSEADRPATGEGTKITPCAVCGEPAAYLGYDGLDPNEQRDPRTGRARSADIARYRPVCVAH